jgi:UDP-N-acetylmuramyl pentapeptide phosphotransferase/UDP-N-acetylglucosamine-1-phosphate transferase
MTLIITIVSIIVFFFINNYIKKFAILLNFKGQKHQKFSGMRNIPLSGGIFLTFSILLLNLENHILSYFVLLVFFLGFVSDTNFLSSPKLRFLIQLLLIISFVLFLDVKIAKTNLFFLDILLNNIYFQYFFSVFCLLVLINGSNFIDGLNGLMLGYFSIILALIFNLEYYLLLQISKLFFINLFLVLIFLICYEY